MQRWPHFLWLLPMSFRTHRGQQPPTIHTRQMQPLGNWLFEVSESQQDPQLNQQPVRVVYHGGVGGSRPGSSLPVPREAAGAARGPAPASAAAVSVGGSSPASSPLRRSRSLQCPPPAGSPGLLAARASCGTPPSPPQSPRPAAAQGRRRPTVRPQPQATQPARGDPSARGISNARRPRGSRASRKGGGRSHRVRDVVPALPVRVVLPREPLLQTEQGADATALRPLRHAPLRSAQPRSRAALPQRRAPPPS